MNITVAQYLALKVGDKIIPNDVYWNAQAGEIVVVQLAASICKNYWDRHAHDYGYNYQNDIPVSALHDDTGWLKTWLQAELINNSAVFKSLLPLEIASVVPTGSERWFDVWGAP